MSRSEVEGPVNPTFTISVVSWIDLKNRESVCSKVHLKLSVANARPFSYKTE